MRRQQTFTHESSKVQLKVTLQSRAPIAEGHPLYRTGDAISGTVELTLRARRRIHLVTVNVGLSTMQMCRSNVSKVLGICLRNFGRSAFLRLSEEAFSSIDEPGTYTKSFSFVLPSETDILDPNGSGKFLRTKLPPSFCAPGFLQYFSYQLVCTVKRGFFSHAEE